MTGPSSWEEHWPIAKNPKYGQSPIDIETDKAEKSEGWKRIKIKFRPERSTRIHNTGHSFQVDVQPPAVELGEKGYSKFIDKSVTGIYHNSA